MKIITAADVRSDVCDYLQGWFDKAKARQEAKGNKFNLTFGDFLNLWGMRRIKSLTEWMDDGSLFVRQRRHTKDNPNLTGYVLSYKSFAASQCGYMDETNAQICTRAKSFEDCKMKKGDKHSEASKAAISVKTAGVPKSEEHRAKIAKSMKGMKRGPMSQAEKDKRAASVRATLARKKAEGRL